MHECERVQLGKNDIEAAAQISTRLKKFE